MARRRGHREQNGCCYNFEGTKLQIVFELKEGARFVLEFGDRGINYMLLTKDRTRILDDKLIHSTLNDYSRQGKIVFFDIPTSNLQKNRKAYNYYRYIGFKHVKQHIIIREGGKI